MSQGRIRAWWREQPKETRALYVTAGSAFTLGVATTALIVHASRSGAPKNAPPPPSPSLATAHPGARLSVRTPKGQAGIVRTGAGIKNKPLGTVPNGTSVTVADVAMVGGGRWYQVDTPIGQGWMSADILTGTVPS